VNAPGHLAVRTRSGYYATPDQGKPTKGNEFPLTPSAMTLIKASKPDDEVFTIHFNDETYFANPGGKDFLTKPEEMREALGRTKPSGGTAMRDAVQVASGWLKKAHKEKKVLVVVTDGEDNASGKENSLEDVVRSARQKDVQIYSVGLLSEEDHKASANAKHQLNTVSEATGVRNAVDDQDSRRRVVLVALGFEPIDNLGRQVRRESGTVVCACLRNDNTGLLVPENPFHTKSPSLLLDQLS
jgi:hypothetical protein